MSGVAVRATPTRLARCVAGAALLVALTSGVGHAVTEGNFVAKTTGDLVEACDPHPGDPLAQAGVAFCLGFAQGAVSLEMEHEAASRQPGLFCLPDPRPKRADTLAEFVTWARASPSRMEEPPTDGLIRFLHERFPCPTGR